MEHSLGLKFGYGVFETIRYDQELIYFDEHMSRLSTSLTLLNMPSIDIVQVKKNCLSLLEGSNFEGVRISVYQDEPVKITYEGRYVDKKATYHVVLSKHKRFKENPLNYIKSSGHLSYFLEKIELKSKGIDESIHLNEDNLITEGIYTNIFFLKDQRLYTPALECGLLSGIYRKKLIEKCHQLNISIEEGYYTFDDLLNADDVFMTNALIGIKSVHQIQDICYERHPMVQRLIEEMEDGCKKNCI